MKPLLKRLQHALYGFFEDYAVWYAPWAALLWLVLTEVDARVVADLDPVQCQRRRIAIVHVSTFVWVWMLQGLYYWLNACAWPQKFRITAGERVEQLRKQYSAPAPDLLKERLRFMDVLAPCVMNQLIYFGLSALFCLYASDGRASLVDPEWGNSELQPGLWRVLCELVPLLALFDLLLGSSHYFLHHGLYQYHKQHHQTKADFPLSSWYMGLVDFILELWIPIFVPVFLLGFSWLSFWIWLLLIEFDGVHSHSAYDFGWPCPSPRRHWLHHHLLYWNYSNGLFDALMGSEARPSQAMSCERIEERGPLSGGKDTSTVSIALSSRMRFPQSAVPANS